MACAGNAHKAKKLITNIRRINVEKANFQTLPLSQFIGAYRLLAILAPHNNAWREFAHHILADYPKPPPKHPIPNEIPAHNVLNFDHHICECSGISIAFRR